MITDAYRQQGELALRRPGLLPGAKCNTPNRIGVLLGRETGRRLTGFSQGRVPTFDPR